MESSWNWGFSLLSWTGDWDEWGKSQLMAGNKEKPSLMNPRQNRLRHNRWSKMKFKSDRPASEVRRVWLETKENKNIFKRIPSLVPNFLYPLYPFKMSKTIPTLGCGLRAQVFFINYVSIFFSKWRICMYSYFITLFLLFWLMHQYF